MDLTKIKSLLEEKIVSLGYEPVSITKRNEKCENILSIVIDKVEPIDMNMIVEVTNELSAYLYNIDDSNEAYMLDISSLGAEKPLKIESLKDYVNRYVNVHVNNAINGENIFEGTIKEVKDDSFILEYRVKTRVKEIVILFNNIYKIRLAIKF